jgi:hypothetical protein
MMYSGTTYTRRVRTPAVCEKSREICMKSHYVLLSWYISWYKIILVAIMYARILRKEHKCGLHRRTKRESH